MRENAERWSSRSDFPDELNPAQNQFSVDVFICFPKLKEHTIGLFDLSNMKWNFLQNQNYEKQEFEWRYFDEGDYPPEKKKGSNAGGHIQGC